MAPSPTTIPTSFVPKRPVQTGGRFARSGGNTFLTLSLIVLALALLGCGAVFGYERYLIGASQTKAAEVQAAVEAIDSATVEDFIRTRDRFASASTLLDSHIATSGFFGLLESVTLQNVRFSALTLTVADDHSAEIKMQGVAKSFNALAAESSMFASEKRIKRAIFSGIKVNEGGTVAFNLSADLDPRLVVLAEDATPTVKAPVVATTTASTTPQP